MSKLIFIIPLLLSPISVAHAIDTSGSYPDCNDNINYARASEKEPVLVWRTENNVLWRGDTSDQGLKAFKEGVLPKGFLKGYPEKEQDHDWRCHKEDSFRSVFVSTTENLKTAINFVDFYHPKKEGYVYEIHAPGGINQQLSIGAPAGSYESEISFPGGVKGKYIKRACYYIKRELDHCVENDDFVEPTWGEKPQDISAVTTNFTRIVPKADCEISELQPSTPELLCLIPNMATTKYFQEGNEIEKKGMFINYDVSDRGPKKPTRWIMLMTGDKKTDFSHIAAKIPVTDDMPDKGSVFIPADKLSSPAFPWQRIFQRWALGISHAADNHQIDGPVSYMHTSYLPATGALLYGNHWGGDGTPDRMTIEKAANGFKIEVTAPRDRDTYLFIQNKNTATGQWGSFAGPSFKIKAGTEPTIEMYIFKDWLTPGGGVARIGLSESVDNPTLVKPIGNTPFIEITDKQEN